MPPLLHRKLLIVSGKGGVGKSAVAASLALRAARVGKRVLAVGLVDALGLASHLGTEDLGYEPHEVHPGVFTFAVDRARALDEYLKLQLHLPRSVPMKQLAQALGLLVDTAPGIREIISMGKPIYDTWRETYDLVIVDAPPLGQVVSYLRAPGTIADLVPAGHIRQQAERMRETLADPATTGLLLVATAEELTVAETNQTIELLQAERLVALAGLVVNRVIPPLQLTADPASLARGPLRDAASLHRSVYELQEEWRERLPTHAVLPYLFGLLTPGEVAARLADEWGAE